MKNKKGVSLAINAIVFIAIGLVVMLVVLGFFLGGFGSSGSSMRDVTAEAEKGGAQDVESGVENVQEIWKSLEGQECEKPDDCREGLDCVDSICTNEKQQRD